MPRFQLFLAGLLLSSSALAVSLADFSQQDSSTALKQALDQGVALAVSQLGTAGGFNDNPQVRIQLPGKLAKVASSMKMLGMGAEVAELENSMNRAAELAVPQARSLLSSAVQKMTVQDAKAILTGPPNAATRYLDKSSREQLRSSFLPIVKQATDQVGLAQQYNQFAGQAASLGVVSAKDANIEAYVTEQALDGLFEIIAQEEANIRNNPAEAATQLAKKVFGAL
jgi:hypothetical protein